MLLYAHQFAADARWTATRDLFADARVAGV
jgi:hypothetical protein